MDVQESRKLARFHLADVLPRRWSHVQGVAGRAEMLLGRLEDGEVLVGAAWLHDLGYSPDLATCRFHPLDGARALRELVGDQRLCGLVAYHSAARFEASALGLGDELHAEFYDENSITRDLLWYLDMTTSPDGEAVTFDDRMDEVRTRYPDDHYVIRALGDGMAERRAAVARAESWLAQAGLAAQV